MTVRELISILVTYKGDTRVVVSGYEDGVDDLRHTENVFLKLDVTEEWYYGAHEAQDVPDEEHNVPALYLR